MTEGFGQVELAFKDEKRPMIDYERVINGDIDSLKDLEKSLVKRFDEELDRAKSERFEGDLREV